jgi:hypothetical protein
MRYPPKRFAIALITAITVGLLVAIPTVVVPAAKRSMAEIEHRQLVLIPLTQVKNGSPKVVIHCSELLSELAADSDCRNNLTEVIFSSMTLKKDDVIALKKLKNVRILGFYSCRGVDEILPECGSLTLSQLYIETSPFAAETLASLATSTSIGELILEQQLSEEEVKALRSFPSSIKVTSTFPLDAYD